MYMKNILMRFFTSSVLAASLILPGACDSTLFQPHKIDIEQGNSITEDEFESLYTGMSEADVLQAIGAPLLTDPFPSGTLGVYLSLQARQGARKGLALHALFQGWIPGKNRRQGLQGILIAPVARDEWRGARKDKDTGSLPVQG